MDFLPESQRKTGGAPTILLHLHRNAAVRIATLIYHFMFGPDFKAGCPSCSSIADGFNGITVHLANHDVMLWAVSRAPVATLQAFKRRMGWSFPWASSARNDFNSDYAVSFTDNQRGMASNITTGARQHTHRRLRHDLALSSGVRGRMLARAGRKNSQRCLELTYPPITARGQA